MVERIWLEIPDCYSGIEIDQFIVMPNHIHGIIVILDTFMVGADPCVCPQRITDVESPKGQSQGIAPTNNLSLAQVIQRFKSLTTKKYMEGVKNGNWQPFNRKLWQRNYYDRIIRNKIEYDAICTYIMNNPLKWEFDKDNPMNL